jgi:hypothetical protein
MLFLFLEFALVRPGATMSLSSPVIAIQSLPLLHPVLRAPIVGPGLRHCQLLRGDNNRREGGTIGLHVFVMNPIEHWTQVTRRAHSHKSSKSRKGYQIVFFARLTKRARTLRVRGVIGLDLMTLALAICSSFTAEYLLSGACY